MAEATLCKLGLTIVIFVAILIYVLYVSRNSVVLYHETHKSDLRRQCEDQAYELSIWLDKDHTAL